MHLSTRGAVVVVIIYFALWAAYKQDTLDWHGAATIAAWFTMTLIQWAGNRNTRAIQGKLDKVLSALANLSIDASEPRHNVSRNTESKFAACQAGRKPTRTRSVDIAP